MIEEAVKGVAEEVAAKIEAVASIALQATRGVAMGRIAGVETHAAEVKGEDIRTPGAVGTREEAPIWAVGMTGRMRQQTLPLSKATPTLRSLATRPAKPRRSNRSTLMPSPKL